MDSKKNGDKQERFMQNLKKRTLAIFDPISINSLLFGIKTSQANKTSKEYNTLIWVYEILVFR